MWDIQKFTISYNANGGSGAPTSQTKKYGENITLSNTKPTRSGYTFQGWATSTTGAVTYKAGTTYSTNANLNLYAIWGKGNNVGPIKFSYILSDDSEAALLCFWWPNVSDKNSDGIVVTCSDPNNTATQGFMVLPIIFNDEPSGLSKWKNVYVVSSYLNDQDSSSVTITLSDGSWYSVKYTWEHRIYKFEILSENTGE